MMVVGIEGAGRCRSGGDDTAGWRSQLRPSRKEDGGGGAGHRLLLLEGLTVVVVMVLGCGAWLLLLQGRPVGYYQGRWHSPAAAGATSGSAQTNWELVGDL